MNKLVVVSFLVASVAGCGHAPAAQPAHAAPAAATATPTATAPAATAANDGPPSAEDCRKALVHAYAILAVADTPSDGDVRRCTQGASAAAVACAIAATSSDALTPCDFIHRSRAH